MRIDLHNDEIGQYQYKASAPVQCKAALFTEDATVVEDIRVVVWEQRAAEPRRVGRRIVTHIFTHTTIIDRQIDRY